MSETLELSAAVFAKTSVGQQEIPSRSLGLSPLVRRILVLVDGKRRGAELATFLAGVGDIDAVLKELLDRGCIEVVATARPAPSKVPEVASGAPPAAAPPAEADTLAHLPPADTRSAQDNEMARNFMINSVNAIIGQQMRISLIHDIFHAQGTEEVRKVYHAWARSMGDHGAGARRLPELREKLFKVL